MYVVYHARLQLNVHQEDRARRKCLSVGKESNRVTKGVTCLSSFKLFLLLHFIKRIKCDFLEQQNFVNL